ncbi:hypothetical protein ACIQOW_08865 [Kitasatospora sp. NPDC091335]|uniref:hypothetical protein n=1 Tax=Kitasatospora sp. NPDC091335 TaxID=3364085 RepID=UPI003801AE28
MVPRADLDAFLLSDAARAAVTEALDTDDGLRTRLAPVVDWLGHLLLLAPVPFTHLVPDSRMLPPESLRFFHTDPNWLDALVGGALGIGAQSSRDTLQDAVVAAAVRTKAAQAAARHRDRQRDAGPGDPDATLGRVCGILLRSALVSGWPHLAVRAVDVAGAPLPVLRVEHLSPTVLLCLFNGVPATVELAEPQEGFRFGVEDDGLIPLRSLLPDAGPRLPLGEQLGPDVTFDVLRHLRPSADPAVRVLDLASLVPALATALESAHGTDVGGVGPADLAPQLVKVPEAIRFDGVHLHWALPRGPRHGVQDPATGEVDYPLVPNRWLVTRFSGTGTRRVRAWVIESDCPHTAYALRQGHPLEHSSPHLVTGATLSAWRASRDPYRGARTDASPQVLLGLAFPLADGTPWTERAAADRLFLTAMGAGDQHFTTYVPHSTNVFSFIDDLSDVTAADTLGYQVIGWYSDPAADVLATLPPGTSYAGLLDRLAAWLGAVGDWGILAQELTGFNDRLAARDTRAFRRPTTRDDDLPHTAGLAGYPDADTEDALPARYRGRVTSVPYLPGGESADFHETRQGQIHVRELFLYDKFGRVLDVVSPDLRQGGLHEYRGFPLIVDTSLTTESSLTPTVAAVSQLPPRPLQPARLDFDLLDAATGTRVVETAADPSPVTGWLLPVHLDRALLLYDPAGRFLGTYRLLTDGSGTRTGQWEPPPDGTVTSLAQVEALAPDLAGLVRSRCLATEANLSAFLDVVDSTLWTTDPLGRRTDQTLSALIGRPLALVRARLRLTLDGPPLTDPGWAATGRRTT